VQRLALADHLKWLAMKTWGFTFEQVFGDELKEVVDPRWGLTPRYCLQRLGTEVGRNIHKETWVRKAFDTIDRASQGERVCWADLENRCFSDETVFHAAAASKWYIPDIRFKDEADAVKARGGLVIKVVRPGLDRPKDTHASETGIEEIAGDYLIVNDGTLLDLEAKVSALGEKLFLPEHFHESVQQAELMGRKP
jgi:hypothetical protein